MKNAAWGGAFLNWLYNKFKVFSVKIQSFFAGLGALGAERIAQFVDRVRGGK